MRFVTDKMQITNATIGKVWTSSYKRMNMKLYKGRFRISLLAILLSVVMSSCEGIFGSDEEIPDQVVLFQYAYINHAWGYQHQGWLIDSSGEVHCFEQPEAWHFPDSTGTLGNEEMMLNLSMADSSCFVVSMDDLELYGGKIATASKGELTDPENVMADAGISGYYVWVYNASTETYHRILLKEKGDWETENQSAAAGAIVEWMEEVRQDIAGE